MEDSIMKKLKKSLSPEQNLMMAVYGTLKPSREQFEKVRDKLYEMQANSVTDEEFKLTWGVSIEEHTKRMMLWCGWLEAITDWNMKHGNERKYHVFEKRDIFSSKQVVDMAQMFYRQGREDERNGVEEYDRLWKLKKKEQQ